MIEVIADASGKDLAAAAELIREYTGTLGIDLSFQNFEAELANLGGAYGPPRGSLLLARDGDKYAGCVGLREFKGADCEMKRLYVRTKFRGSGIGRALVEASMAKARDLGYQRIVLDTLPGMLAALSLYRSLGFEDTEPYYPNPVTGARYMMLRL
jgi:ribosomal protein S18 acetylase RimI-like enzyme